MSQSESSSTQPEKVSEEKTSKSNSKIKERSSNEKAQMIKKKMTLQSVEVAPPENDRGEIRRHSLFSEKLVESWDENIKTLFEMFNAIKEKNPKNKCFGMRKKLSDGNAGEYEWETFEQIADRRDKIAFAFRHLGVQTQDTIGIYSRNRTEWILMDMAANAISCPSVSLYDTLGADSIKYIINHADIKIVGCSEKQFPNLLSVASDCPQLKTIICFDEITEENKKEATDKDIKLLSMKELEELGSNNPSELIPPKPDDLYTIMYTSGTTGNPKGVMLKHRNFIAEIAGASFHEGYQFFEESEVHLSYLPLAHSFERTILYLVISIGASVGFSQGIVTEIVNDIAALQPTFLIGAPRVWSRIHDKLSATIETSGALKKTLFHKGYSSKRKTLRKGKSSKFWDTVVFSKTKARLGGRVKWIMSGSAPLDPKLAEFLKICFCCVVVEGYGLTETCAGAFSSHLEETTFGHVGSPLPCVEVRLADVPEMNYYAKEKKGEILLRGPNLFCGYFKEPEKTKEVLEEDGWFHTGDIGKWNDDGTLRIIDRKKNIFKLSQGEYVAVEYLEGVYLRSKYVAQVWVYGNSFKRYLVAIVVPDFEVLELTLQKQGIKGSHEELCNNETVKKIIVDDLAATGKEAKLNGFEFLKAIHLEHVPFSVENDLMTPTFKLRRVQLLQHYQEQIDKLYEVIEPNQLDSK